ncbi:MAG: peptide chain release factor N(5)-glutamine methyltransferase [Lachnospiraceae bacterium]|nr:peptide chain release factor N(5)-glutamine methyltransferase [Lachnospiraceae bacterium]
MRYPYSADSGRAGCAELVKRGSERLARCDIRGARHDARALFLYVSGMTLAQYAARTGDPVGEDTAVRYHEAIERRAAGEPLQYITGTAPFYGRDFTVNEDVLIPRFDTETLTEAALPYLSGGDRILDLCTGSGCILITLLLEGPPGLKGTGSDISPGALACARANAERFGVSADFILSDLFENVTGTYDLITANPPYIRSRDIRELDREVRDHEPSLALDGGEDGLIFYRNIAKGAGEHLTGKGVLAFEAGFDQAEDVAHILNENGFTDIHIIRDQAGRDRVIIGVKNV